MYFDRNATMSGAKRRGQPGWIAGRTPRGFHHRLFGRDGSPAEPPPGELGRVGFITGCLAGMDRRPSPHRENWAAWVSSQAVWPGWIAGRAPTGRTGPRGFHHRLFGRDGSPGEPPPGELGRVGFTTGCLAGMDRRASPHRENWAAWVSPPAVESLFETVSERGPLRSDEGLRACLTRERVNPRRFGRWSRPFGRLRPGGWSSWWMTRIVRTRAI